MKKKLPSVTTVIRPTSPLSDGTFIIYIRLTYKGVATYRKTGFRAKKKDFSSGGLLKGNVPMFESINEILITKRTEVLLKALEHPNLSGPEVFALIDEIEMREAGKVNETFQAACESVVEKYVQESKFDRAERFRRLLKNVNDYKPVIQLKDINKDWIREFISFLTTPRSTEYNRAGGKVVSRPVKPNTSSTIRLKIKLFSVVLDQAVRDKYIGENILKDYQISAGSKKIKSVLDTGEIIALEAVEDKLNKKQRVCLHMYLTQYYTMGTRISDIILLKNSNISGNNILFQEGKKGVWKQVDIHPKLLSILSEYRQGEYVFPFCTYFYDTTKSAEVNERIKKDTVKKITSVINTNLKKIAEIAGITKNIPTHTARHTFAHRSNRALKDIRLTQQMLGHSKSSTTEQYLHDLERSDFKEAIEKIY